MRIINGKHMVVRHEDIHIMCRALDKERFACSKILILSANPMLCGDTIGFGWIIKQKDIVGKRVVNPSFISGTLNM